MKKALEFLETRKSSLIDELQETRFAIKDFDTKLEDLKSKEIDLIQNIESIEKAITHIKRSII